MAQTDLEHKTHQGNTPDDLLPTIASVYVALQDLHQAGRHLWPEDEDPLILCLDRLFDAALTLEIKTPEQALALMAIAKPKYELNAHSDGPYDQAEYKVVSYACKTLPKVGFEDALKI